MKENKNMIEQAVAARAPAEQEDGFLPMVNELYAFVNSGEAPEGFDLETACHDTEFVTLANEYGVPAAARIWMAEKRASEAEKSAMARVNRQVQERKGLPRSASGGGYAAAKPDYAGMDSDTFRKLSESYRRRARNGERVPL